MIDMDTKSITEYKAIFDSFIELFDEGDEDKPYKDGRCPGCGYTCRCGCASN